MISPFVHSRGYELCSRSRYQLMAIAGISVLCYGIVLPILIIVIVRYALP